MKNILEVSVSCYEKCFTPHKTKTVNLLMWLTSDKYADIVETIRAEQDKTERDRLKRQLPIITPSGIFPYRNSSSYEKHSGFIQFDIDPKDNPHLNSLQKLRATQRKLATLPHVAYCGLSSSGLGLWGLVLIQDGFYHSQHFEFMYREFGSMGIKLDRAPANIASPRFYSFDTEAYFNHQAKAMRGRYNPAKEAYKLTASRNPTDDQAKVEACIQEIVRQGTDITTSYLSDWLPIGSNFASTFGESGRGYFHQVSQFHPEYTYSKTDRQYDRCLKRSMGMPSLGTFLARCAEKGINFTELLQVKL